MMASRRFAVAVFAFGCAACEPCLAHGFAGSGWLHPLTGLDHMLAMLAVGAWSAQLGGRALYLVPMAFVLAMALGSVAGVQQWPITGTESAIALSVLGLGGAIAMQTRLAWPIAAVATMLFGMAHGYAHGAEMPQAADMASYVAGFLVTTAGLHVTGAIAGLLMLEQFHGRIGLRAAGAAVALAAMALMAH